MTTRSDRFESDGHDQNASRVPSRENVGLLSRRRRTSRHAAARRREPSSRCRRRCSSRTGRAGPGRTAVARGVGSPRRSARRSRSRAGRGQRDARGRPSALAGAPAASGRARASRAGGASSTVTGDRLDEAGGSGLRRVGGEPGGEEAIDVVGCGHDTGPSTSREARASASRTARIALVARWSRDFAVPTGTPIASAVSSIVRSR